MNISRISAILYACQKFADQNLELWQLAALLEEPFDKLRALFSANNIIELGGALNPGITTQDVVNTILMFYALKPYHTFVETAFAPKRQDLKKKPKQVSEPIKKISPP